MGTTNAHCGQHTTANTARCFLREYYGRPTAKSPTSPVSTCEPSRTRPDNRDTTPRAEAWRYEGPFTRWNRFKGGLPGLGTASVAFAGYCAYEYFFLEDEHHHGEEHH